MKTLRDYYNLYLKCDVSPLANVFEKFRNSSLKNYGFFPGHYFSAPALSWDAMFNMTKLELEFFQDRDIYILFEKGTTGGASYICNRYSKANNKYLKAYDPNEETKHII